MGLKSRRSKHVVATVQHTQQNEGSPLYVMAKHDGRWLLTACQNTEVLGS